MPKAPVFECIENIDIGGPAMIRWRPKPRRRRVVVEPNDYAAVLAVIDIGGNTRALRKSRRQCAHHAYDAAINCRGELATTPRSSRVWRAADRGAALAKTRTRLRVHRAPELRLGS
jgi:AICAR transformylase/IMP cyclohydrolase PurH